MNFVFLIMLPDSFKFGKSMRIFKDELFIDDEVINLEHVLSIELLPWEELHARLKRGTKD